MERESRDDSAAQSNFLAAAEGEAKSGTPGESAPETSGGRGKNTDDRHRHQGVQKERRLETSLRQRREGPCPATGRAGQARERQKRATQSTG